MALVKFKFNPGIDKEGTEYTADSGWFDGDKVRFRKGRPEKIGGWAKYSQNSIKGVPRSLHDWKISTGSAYLGVGTNLKYYVEQGETFFDITPIRETTAAGDVTFSASNGDATITVSDTSHGASANDFVTFSGAVSLGGNITADVLNQEYQIATTPSADTYTIEAKDTNGATVTANASDTGNGGASVVGEYQIGVGLNAFVSGTGFGVGTYGSGSFGSSSTLSAANQLRIYTEDVFGEDLIFAPRGGAIYYWDQSSGTSTRAVELGTLGGASDAPDIALQVMVSDIDRHVICFGVNPIGSATIDPLFVRWSDQESAVDWTPTATNTAGGSLLSTGSIIIGALKTRQEILIWTDEGVHSMRYTGSPFTFSFSVLNEGLSMLSPKAAVTAGDNVYFMDKTGFYMYNGSFQRIPCSVLSHVYDNLNLGQAYKAFAVSNLEFHEVTWFYPVGTGNTDVTNYVTYNYLENNWSIGTLSRGAWIQANTKNYPVASSNDIVTDTVNYIYNQEFGYDDDGSAMTAYLESGGIELDDGNNYMMVSRMIPDFSFSGAAGDAVVDMTIKGKDFPSATASTLATAIVENDTTQNYIRARTREAVIKIQSDQAGFGWRMGDIRFDLKKDGRR